MIKRLITFSLFIAISGTCNAEIYSWKDENGVVIYSQTPPPDTNAEQVKLKDQSTPSSASPQTRLDRLRQRLEDSREDRELAKKEKKELHKKNQILKKNCQTARANLKKLEGLGKRLLRTPDGEYLRLTEEERQSRIKQAKQQIKENCVQRP
jgi:chromosome segregation ATPase